MSVQRAPRSEIHSQCFLHALCLTHCQPHRRQWVILRLFVGICLKHLPINWFGEMTCPFTAEPIKASKWRLEFGHTYLLQVLCSTTKLETSTVLKRAANVSSFLSHCLSGFVGFVGAVQIQLSDAPLCLPALVKETKMWIFDIHDNQYLNNCAKDAFAIALILACCCSTCTTSQQHTSDVD